MIISSHELVMSASHTVEETSYENTNYNQCNGKSMDIIIFSLFLIEEFSFLLMRESRKSALISICKGIILITFTQISLIFFLTLHFFLYTEQQTLYTIFIQFPKAVLLKLFLQGAFLLTMFLMAPSTPGMSVLLVSKQQSGRYREGNSFIRHCNQEPGRQL